MQVIKAIHDGRRIAQEEDAVASVTTRCQMVSSTIAQRIHKEAESLGGLASTWVVQVIPRKRRAPVVKDE
jgi:hypothetical protein